MSKPIGARRATPTQGHVAVYARDARWRAAVAKSLTEAGHSHREAANPEELRELLLRQRFDVLGLKLRDEEDAVEVSETLDDVTPPPHTILLGHASALPLTLTGRTRGAVRYVPGKVPAAGFCRLVDASLSAGAGEEYNGDGRADGHAELVDLHEAIERAAAAVYPKAKRRRQQFNTVVEGPGTDVLAHPAKLRRTLTALLGLVVSLAPQGALIAVRAEAGDEEWLIRIRATSTKGARRSPAEVTEAIREETKTLAAAAREIQEQGGMFWVELPGRTALAFCLTLPLPPDARSASA